MTPSALDKNDFLIRLEKQNGTAWAPLIDSEADLYFNRARCECGAPIRIIVELTATGLGKAIQITRGDLKVMAGQAECASPMPATHQGATCTTLLDGSGKLATLANEKRLVVTTTVRDLFPQAKDGGQSQCDAERSQLVVLWVDPDPDGKPNPTDPPTKSVQLYGRLPPAPLEVRVSAGHEALEVTWKGLTAYPDLRGYTVLCSRDGNAVFAPSFYDNQFQTRTTLCGMTGQPLTAAGGDTPGAAFPQAATLATASDRPLGTDVPVPPEFTRLDPAYVCADLAQSSTRLSILQNGIPYLVGVAAVDKRGNASAIERAVMQVPAASQDFYRGYREAGGVADGGYCALGRRRASVPETAALLALISAAALGRRHRRRADHRTDGQDRAGGAPRA